MNDQKKRVLIFETRLIPYSETFIPGQAEKFTTFTPYYTGVQRVKGLPLPEDRVVPPTSSARLARLREWAYVLGWVDPWFANAVRRARPALVHAHFEYGGLRSLPLAQSLKIPLVVTCHGVDVTDTYVQWQNRPFLGEYFQGRRKKMFGYGSLFVGISRFICDQMIRRGYPEKKIRLHYIGVDIERFQPDPTVAKEPMILFVGRMVEKKGCIDLLRAMKQVNAKYPDVKLKICGNGPLLDDLQAFAREAKINVEFCGAQPSDIIQQWVKSALMLCLPSVRARNGDSEGLGIVNLEAQASGIPVVGTMHGGIPEAVEHGVTGLLSPERDANALAENILTLLSDTGLREKMGVAARARMEKHFDLQKQSALLETYYNEILQP